MQDVDAYGTFDTDFGSDMSSEIAGSEFNVEIGDMSADIKTDPCRFTQPRKPATCSNVVAERDQIQGHLHQLYDVALHSAVQNFVDDSCVNFQTEQPLSIVLDRDEGSGHSYTSIELTSAFAQAEIMASKLF